MIRELDADQREFLRGVGPRHRRAVQFQEHDVLVANHGASISRDPQ